MTPDRAQELLSNFRTKRILVIGDIVLDQYIQGTVERINPEAPVPILHARQQTETTGGAGNTAKNAAMLGAQTTLISVIGNDETGPRIEQAAELEGYRPLLIRDATRPSIRKVRYLSGSHQMLRVDYEETHSLVEEVEDRLLVVLEKNIENFDAVIVSDYAKGVITPAIAQAVLKYTKTRRLLLAADVKPSRATYFSGATFIAPNFKEGHEFLGLNHLDQPHSKEEIAQALVDKMDTTVFLTLSADGIYVQGSNITGTHVLQQFVPEVADPSGAGDTATVVLCLALLCGATPIEAAELANAAGAVVVGKVGSVGLTLEELSAMLHNHHA